MGEGRTVIYVVDVRSGAVLSGADIVLFVKLGVWSIHPLAPGKCLVGSGFIEPKVDSAIERRELVLVYLLLALRKRRG